MSNLLQEKPRSTRRNDLDWLRVFAVLLLVYFHSAAVFYQGELGEFYVTNTTRSSALSLLIWVVYQWHMPLFFFLAGAASWYSLQLRSASAYVSERIQRLAVPLVVGILTLVPPQVYLNRLSQEAFQGSYLEFYPHFFNGIRPDGNFEWAHLWFIAYLFVLSIVALPIFLKLKSSAWLDKNFSVIILIALAIPLALIEAIFRPRWLGFQNLYDDWANVLLYFTYLIYGYGLGSSSAFQEVLNRYRSILITVAIATMSVLVSLWVTDSVPDRGYSLAYMSYQAFRGVDTWCWIVALLSVGQHFLELQNRWLQYLSEAAYPIYLIHQTIVVSIAFYVVKWNVDITLKFIVISTASLGLTLLAYELLVRRWGVIRSLVGLKPSK